jgi:DNA polymerase delta subunit 2
MILRDVRDTSNVGKLLSTPTDVNKAENVYSRVNCNFRNLSERFGQHSRDYAKQFSHIYAVRLTKMRDLLMKRIRNKWGNVCVSYIEVM